VQYRVSFNHAKGILMRAQLPLALIATLLIATGCDNPRSPDAVAKETAKAEQKADKEVAKSEEKADKDIDKAADKVGDRMMALNNTAANDAYNVALARADGDRKVALANCSALAGDAQKACKDQADADYAAAKANAKAAAQSETQ
jgi:hypothetical protein